MLSHGLFSIPAVKGVEFGAGFALTEQRGSRVNDAFHFELGHVVTTTNHNGGINGGITNGMPLLFRTAIKPTPSIAIPQKTVDISTGKETTIQVGGRHDPCILPRARVVQDSITALILLNFLEDEASETGSTSEIRMPASHPPPMATKDLYIYERNK